MKGVRTTRKLHRKKPKRHGGTHSDSRRQSTIRKKVIIGPTETREFYPSPTEQDITDADLQNKIDYYTKKLARAKSSNVSLQRELNGMKTTGLTTLEKRNTKLLQEYTQNRYNDKSPQHTRQALLKSRAQITELEEAISNIESEIAANNYKIAMYQQYIAHPQSIGRLLQTRRRHESRQNPRIRMTPSERGEIISSANQKLRETRPYKTG
jgi:hypothetical protein